MILSAYMNMLDMCSDTGYTGGRFLRWHPDPVKPFQGIVKRLDTITFRKVAADKSLFFLLQSRLSSNVNSAGGTTHGGCGRTSMPSPVRSVSQ